MKISVIIPSYNSVSTIACTLDVLLKEPQELLQEIIVVDSSDDEKTKILLRNYKERIHLIELSQKTIPATARNLGAKEALGDTLAFIDSDAFPAKNWLININDAREQGSRVGGGSILLPVFQRRNLLAVAQYFLQFNEFMNSGEVREKKFVPSCNLYCEKGFFKTIGGFPEIRASEDVLFGILANTFSKVMFYPQIQVHHIFRNQLGAYIKNQILLGKYILLYRRRGRFNFFYKAWVVLPLIPVVLFVKLFRMGSRILRHQKNFIPFLAALPLFMLGLFYWAVGFFQASFQKEPTRAY